ncbi:DgyrCDS8130 [Dimorphilus gyrociliatus]|uniref:DgyrCDS8130 n=1 Tax=Dimorphilus gyrociliatus TaxID=2664684 RepID=A0A7I8VUA1_9ANNE|nr:DgyrCDS8130 [Dimorphilus gyrociliatus]
MKTLSKIFSTFLFILSLICLIQTQELVPVPELFLEKYVGRWFTAYTSQFVMDTTQRDGFCSTADYGFRLDGNVSVFNAQRIRAPDGPARNISGKAIPSERVGVFTVRLNGVPTPPAPNYYVIKLGPQTFGPNKFYEYAIISEPTRLNLFVLARNISDFKTRFDAEVTDFLQAEGFNPPGNPYVEQFQGSRCIYPKSRDIVPVNELEVDRYYGRWYQIYGSKFVLDGVQRNGFCSVAIYGPLPDGNISVYNYQRQNSPSGPPYGLGGIAYPSNRPGVLSVQLAGVPRIAPYWVIKLGPKTFGFDGYYEYALVSEPTKLNLFVLARNVDDFNQRFDQEVRDFLDEEGFNSEDNPYRRVVHGGNCVYPAYK